MLSVVSGIGLHLLGVGSAIKGVAAKLPWQVWVGIALAIALVVGVVWHGHAKKSFGDERFQAGVAAGKASRDAEVKRLQTQISADGAKLSVALRSQNNAKYVAVDRTASVVFVRGPGRAACTPVTPAASGGPEPSGGQADAPVPAVPAGQGQPLIGLPVAGAVGFARQNDECLADRDTYANWFAKYAVMVAQYNQRAARGKK